MQYFGFDRTLGQMRTFGLGIFEWTPIKLFKNNEQGAWYDPSNISTLFQDAAMTIPVTANGDPVGAMMDLSGNGNHAIQSVSAYRPTYQVGDDRGVVNLIPNSETFNHLVTSEVTLKAVPSILSPTGSSNVTHLSANTNAYRPRVVFGARNVGTYSIYAKAAEWNKVFLGSTNGTGYWSMTGFDLSNGTVFNHYQVSTGAKVSNPTIEAVGDGWYRCSVESEISYQFTAMPTEDGAHPTFTTTTAVGGEGVYIWGAQSEYSTTLTPYQVNGNHLGGVGTGKVTDLHWLAFDGVDDFLSSNLINLSHTTAALMVISRQIVSVNGASNISYLNGNVNPSSMQEYQRGSGRPTALLNTGSITVSQAYDATISVTAKNIVDIQFDSSKVGRIAEMDMRVNGATRAMIYGGASDSGSQNLGNNPLVLGGMAGGYSNMLMFGVIFREGVTDNQNRIVATEYLANKSGVTL